MWESKDVKETKVLVQIASLIFTPVLNLDRSVVIWCDILGAKAHLLYLEATMLSRVSRMS